MPTYGTPLGPKPGSRKRANKLNTSGLGRSLVNQRQRDRGTGADSDRYTTDLARPDLRSVTQQHSLDEFLSTAELADTDFTTERTSNIKIISSGAGKSTGSLPTAEQRKTLAKQHYDNAGRLTVPRRPKWSKDMSALELDRLEKDAFLAWRRSLADLQDNKNLLLTPFERNLEVWRQLWRVVERSDLVVQIVDARNPILFRSEDLDAYVKEVGDDKRTLLLVNKADLLSEGQRRAWKSYFEQNGITFAFFSAKAALVSQENGGDTVVNDAVDGGLLNTVNILNVSELEILFTQAGPSVDAQLQVGLVGYPNVGKSSTINALIGAKKVSVSSTPGKTKHFQTIQISPDMMLCDCPGLVFPNFAQTNADLVCSGVLPIDQLRDFWSPVTIACQRIPQYYIEALYGINILGDFNALSMLSAYAAARGYMRTGTGSGPDTSRAARYVLKDLVNAKLLWCEPPPTYPGTASDFNARSYVFRSLPQQRQSQLLEAVKGKTNVSDLDDDLDLENEMRNLTFAQSEATSRKQHFNDADADLDREFFSGGGGNSTANLPFHMRGAADASSKKHFKGRKGH